MAQLTYTLPTVGNPNSSEAPLIRTALSNILTDYNSNIDLSNIAASLKTYLGLGSTGRGKSIIATTESRSNVAYGTMPTADQVTVTLGTDGLIQFAFQALWQESVAAAASAAVFLGANQLTFSNITGAPGLASASTGGGSAAHDLALVSFPGGIFSPSNAGVAVDATGVTTGQIIGTLTPTSAAAAISGLGPPPQSSNQPTVSGGVCTIFAAAGSYTISVQFKSSSGSVTVKNRKLWVWTMGF